MLAVRPLLSVQAELHQTARVSELRHWSRDRGDAHGIFAMAGVRTHLRSNMRSIAPWRPTLVDARAAVFEAFETSARSARDASAHPPADGQKPPKWKIPRNLTEPRRTKRRSVVLPVVPSRPKIAQNAAYTMLNMIIGMVPSRRVSPGQAPAIEGVAQC